MPGVPPFAREDPRWKQSVWGWNSRGFLRDQYRNRIEELVRVCEADGQDHGKEQYAYWAYLSIWQCEFWEPELRLECIAPNMSSAQSRALKPGTEVLAIFTASAEQKVIWSMGTGQIVATQERPLEALRAFDNESASPGPTLGLDDIGCLAWGSECWFVDRPTGDAWLKRKRKAGYNVWPLDIRELRLERSLEGANVCGVESAAAQ